MSWIAEITAAGEVGRSRLTLQFDDKPSHSERATFKAEVIAVHRRIFQEWAEAREKLWELDATG